MKKIVVIGSSNTDMVIKSERFPAPGETVIGDTFLMNSGGKGANQAVSIARLKGNVTFISKIGDDVFGKRSIELYKSEGINTTHIFIDSQNPSGVAIISVDSYGENCIVVAPGANACLSVNDMEKIQSVIETGDIILMQLEIPLKTVEYVSEIAERKGIKVILNPAPAQHLPLSLLKRLYAITPNEIEAEMLSDVKVTDWESAKKAADFISNKGVKNVIITLGEKGALLKENSTYYMIDAEKVEAIDTTAAGDTFNGALCVGLSEDMPLLEAVKFACKAASFTVTRMGAQSSIPYRRELKVKNNLSK